MMFRISSRSPYITDMGRWIATYPSTRIFTVTGTMTLNCSWENSLKKSPIW